MTSEQIRKQILVHLKAEAARTPEEATPYEFWTAVSRTIMQLLADNWPQRPVDTKPADRLIIFPRILARAVLA